MLFLNRKIISYSRCLTETKNVIIIYGTGTLQVKKVREQLNSYQPVLT